jgi:glycerol-3-phosphate dehydrogenase
MPNSARTGRFDCLVLGGGITGAGVARDAAMRGLATLLVDSHDFASGTSHVTSKLIHGGLRYLDQGKIRLAAEGIMERDRLLHRLAPNLVHPLKFVIPYEARRFPKWLLTVVGIQSYGFLELCRNGRGCKPLFGPQLRRDYPTMLEHPLGVSYWDAQTNDARLVMATLRTAQAHGATLLNYTMVEDAQFERDAWRVVLSGAHGPLTVHARSIVNATGPWTPHTNRLLGVEPVALLWIKGSHLLLRRPQRFGNDAVIIRSVRDLRPLWVIPWETRLIVGSTERRFHGDLRDVRPDTDEIDDLWDSLVHYFPRHDLSRDDIRGAYAGVRPIIEQTGESDNRLSRKYEILLDGPRRLVTVNGGKLTTFRRMAEKTVDALDGLLGRPAPPPALRRQLRHARLWPGLNVPEADRLSAELARSNGASVAGDILDHWVRVYGREAATILVKVAAQPAWGKRLFPGLPYCLAELAYLFRAEQVRGLLDLVKRRTSIYFLADEAGAGRTAEILQELQPVHEWDSRRQEQELESLIGEFRADCAALPQAPRVAFPELREAIPE